MTTPRLMSLRSRRDRGETYGITSVCSAHPDVIRAALTLGRDNDQPVLIEATCNQVNQDGGYTGMTPAKFRTFVEEIAESVSFDMEGLILGGDHLGPNPWKHLPATDALAKAKEMVAAYASAGFSKLHLDCSMGCSGEPEALEDDLVARRAAELAAVAEDNSAVSPVYIIGTEVPVPGGASHAVNDLDVTDPAAARRTYEVHSRSFSEKGLEAAFQRVIGLVVQPGVEFGNANVVAYQPDQARKLSQSLTEMPNVVFEAHSTDYQTAEALSALVDGGFAILKVGPGLTFALREALYGLDLIASELDGEPPILKRTMETIMMEDRNHWEKYYPGNPSEQRIQRHFSYSDRIRYYWSQPVARQAVDELRTRLVKARIPETLISQYLSPLTAQVRSGDVSPDFDAVVLAYVQATLRDYAKACGH
ncbi:D-tagatose-bisphosphate aldolase, class II, non-catalytic subunit [Neorhizobium galegae]|uniref:D-tagatose-bisphosphate aldolase, class II, non-catalytic subunit n=1 Tax=Neorhizobium galegae TaxID=399 RepID=UPI0013544CB5|nr:D-tagatose-bisphosphate aldolase, class II, non-catalytic subunit [Neorhizobium galegae]KAB1115058.1 D-tagatose-bisphosphate aldolase, class II, non-catalytic subunit [Neorhizobium galegae]MCQ1774393.1 D-tagatose-bisphosphate aldolase, class II, non-catalytic subunit [Neorhizobium galegae]MCQ1798949.1 D-tagatose-bisphosphate aldolase, class II, non-catalytic subunit [Neorhizobium galegae]